MSLPEMMNTLTPDNLPFSPDEPKDSDHPSTLKNIASKLSKLFFSPSSQDLFTHFFRQCLHTLDRHQLHEGKHDLRLFKRAQADSERYQKCLAALRQWLLKKEQKHFEDLRIQAQKQNDEARHHQESMERLDKHTQTPSIAPLISQLHPQLTAYLLISMLIMREEQQRNEQTSASFQDLSLTQAMDYKKMTERKLNMMAHILQDPLQFTLLHELLQPNIFRDDKDFDHYISLLWNALKLQATPEEMDAFITLSEELLSHDLPDCIHRDASTHARQCRPKPPHEREDPEDNGDD